MNIFKNNKKLYQVLAIIIACFAIIMFVKNDAFLYKTPVASVTSVHNTKEEPKTGFDGKREYEEAYYSQVIKAKVLNGKNKGKIVTLKNEYGNSLVYDSKYKKGDQVFIESLTTSKDGLTAVISGSKRDYYVALALTIMTALFLIIGEKEGFITLLSLAINLIFFYFVLVLYFKGHNILLMCIPMAIIFTALLLFSMYGKNRKTLLSFVASMIALVLTTLITVITMHFSGNIDYDFMDYLIQPYDQKDANYIFLSEVIICSMGAIMDVVITIIATIDEIVTLRKGEFTSKEILASSRKIGDEIVGTMISIMFFTNIAAVLPLAIISMRNGIALTTVLRYNSFFEIARFLIGSIGTVLAIPVSAGVAILYYRKRYNKEEKEDAIC